MGTRAEPRSRANSAGSLAALPIAVLLAAMPLMGAATGNRDGRVRSADGVEIAYSVRGTQPTALVFVHGGLADRTFWKNQLSDLSDRYTVVAMDLGGHGESGRGRKTWSISSWGEDVRAVVQALKLRRVVLIGNSLGGPVAVEAARLLGDATVLGVVGVDTLHDFTQKMTAAQAHERAEAFRRDFGGACRELVAALFHPGTQADLRVWAERRMCATPQDVAAGMMEGMADYDVAAGVRNAGVPIRAINGDLWPVNVAGNRKIAPDFDVVVMKGAGHYPMLERPEEFDRHLVEMVGKLDQKR